MAWGLELILKLHGKIDIDLYPLQDGNKPCDYNFGQLAQNVLLGYGISSDRRQLDWSDFANFSFQQVQSGSFPIFALPLSRRVELSDYSINDSFHTFVIAPDEDMQLSAWTTGFGIDGYIKIDHPAKLFQASRQIVSNCLVDSLAHKSL